MPYVKSEKRRDIKGGVIPETPGELNYAICRMATHYLGPKPDYRRFNDLIGALENAKQELYRRLIVPYEDLKRVENGDLQEFQDIILKE